MSDDKPRDPQPDDATQPVRPGPGPTLPPPPAAAPAGSAYDAPPAGSAYDAPPAAAGSGRRGFGERFRTWRGSGEGGRTFGLAALIASALAGVIVGGLGFAAVHAVTDDGPHDRGGWMQREGIDGDDPGQGPVGRGGMHGGPPGLPGQVQPTTPPDDDDSYDSGGSSS
jgi:hypothetical protein